MTEINPQPCYRVGRHVGRTIYRQIGPEPSDVDELAGVMDTPELAALAVAGMNQDRKSAYRAGREDAARPLQEVADAAIAWRAQFEKPADSKPPRMAALIDAVDRLINGQSGEDQDTPEGRG